jgi:hypothetical protein
MALQSVFQKTPAIWTLQGTNQCGPVVSRHPPGAASKFRIDASRLFRQILSGMNRLQSHHTCHRPGAYWITLLGRRLWQSATPISAEYNNYNIHNSSDHSERRSNFRQKFQEPGNDRLVYSLPRVLAFALHGVCRWYYITILNTDELAFLFHS